VTNRLETLEDEYRDYLIESGEPPDQVLRLTARDFVDRNEQQGDPGQRLGGDLCDPRITEMAALLAAYRS
jgi:hypothetical protein